MTTLEVHYILKGPPLPPATSFLLRPATSDERRAKSFSSGDLRRATSFSSSDLRRATSFSSSDLRRASPATSVSCDERLLLRRAPPPASREFHRLLRRLSRQPLLLHQIETSEELEKVSTADERQSFIAKLDEVQEWLYMDGEDVTAAEFQERLNLLKAIGDPIFFRLKELTERPAAVGHAQSYLDQLQKVNNTGVGGSIIDADALRTSVDPCKVSPCRCQSTKTYSFVILFLSIHLSNPM
ncbi:hypothetical protein EUGRSUZ_C00679 [Eucalyptus grandis]|uniref:Uncharacterized protein n=2 Tax=Eucalyptus grandis TaxID=71139 RepID=A0ACC3LAU4_EUCGR|nr:hypothetical protein EUGRSUZ_C00679 [Eucalyptus grandis]